jgi:hypothetical protein
MPHDKAFLFEVREISLFTLAKAICLWCKNFERNAPQPSIKLTGLRPAGQQPRIWSFGVLQRMVLSATRPAAYANRWATIELAFETEILIALLG